MINHINTGVYIINHNIKFHKILVHNIIFINNNIKYHIKGITNDNKNISSKSIYFAFHFKALPIIYIIGIKNNTIYKNENIKFIFSVSII